MNPKKDALPFIESKFDKYGIDWINKGRMSDDFKFLIYGRPNRGKQIGIYNRKSTIVRLEKYDQVIEGVTLLPKCAKTDTVGLSYSNFKNERGVCVEVMNAISLEKLLDSYFGVITPEVREPCPPSESCTPRARSFIRKVKQASAAGELDDELIAAAEKLLFSHEGRGMGSSHDDFWYRTLFKLKLHEASGTSFQQFINQLFQYSVEGFQSIQPWGNWGDGGNDGWVPLLGSYYQVYGPTPTSMTNPVTVVNKAVEDFEKLPEKWKNINNYYFVYNDRFAGVPAPLASELQQLQQCHGLLGTGAIVGADLESLFMNLEPSIRQLIVGGIPNCEITYVDSRSVGDLLTHLADKSDAPLSYLTESAPDFSEKIAFNGLSEQLVMICADIRTKHQQSMTFCHVAMPVYPNLSQERLQHCMRKSKAGNS